jgi:ankyrin repeat protein
MLKYLLSKGADINNKSTMGRTALSKASFNGLIDVVKLLLTLDNIDMNQADVNKRTPIHNAVWGQYGGRMGKKGSNSKDSPECLTVIIIIYNLTYIVIIRCRSLYGTGR